VRSAAPGESSRASHDAATPSLPSSHRLGFASCSVLPQADGARTGDPDVDDGLSLSEIADRLLVVVPHRTDPHGQPALARRLGAHRADGLAVPIAVVVDDEHVAHAGLLQPLRDGERADAVVRGEAHERVALQPGEGGDRCDLQQSGLPQARRGRLHLRGMEVAEVGQRRAVLDRLLRVGNCARIAILRREAVEDHELDRTVRGLERDLRPAQHVAAGVRGGTGERQAGVDAAHDSPESTPAPRARRSRSRRR